MKTMLLILTIIFAGCSSPGNKNASFCLLGFSPDQEVLIVSALDEWNEKGGNSFTVAEENCDVKVYYGGETNGGVVGKESSDNTKITLKSITHHPDRLRIFMLHETGHYLADSADHVDNPHAIMHESYTGQEHLIQDDLNYVK